MTDQTSATDIETLLSEGLALHKAGQLAKAKALYDQALDLDETSSEALHLSGLLNYHAGKLDDALDLLNRAIALGDAQPKYHNNLGAVYLAKGQAVEAESAFRAALELDGKDADGFYNLGDSLAQQGRLDDAIDAFGKAISVAPDFAEAFYNRARLAQKKGLVDDAIADYQHALKINPAFEQAQNNLAMLMRAKGDNQQALAGLHQAARDNADSAVTQYNLGLTLLAEGRDEEGLDALKDAAALAPDEPRFTAALVSRLFDHCDWEGLMSSALSMVDQSDAALAEDRRPAELPAVSLLLSPDAHRSRRIAESWAKHAVKTAGLDGEPSAYHLQATPRSEAPIRIGYLGAVCGDNPIGRVMAPMLENHDKEALRVHLYVTADDDGSPWSERPKMAVGGVTDCSTLTDQALADKIFNDGIDILVDMAGFAAGGRPGVLARRPAPLQVSWLGYLGSTGASYMDYVLSDPTTITDIIGNAYCERLCRLPYSTLCIEAPLGPSGQPTPKRGDFGLPDDAFVIAAPGSLRALNARGFRFWMALLAETPKAVLWLPDCSNMAKAKLRRAADSEGISPDRLIFAPAMDWADRMASLALADIALDTPVVNSWAEMVEALQAGLPVLTVTGDHAASRISSGLLKAAGLGSLVMGSETELKKRLAELVASPDRLAALKVQTGQATEQKYLFDVKAFADDLMRAYQAMWALQMAGKEPLHLTIHDQRAK